MKSAITLPPKTFEELALRLCTYIRSRISSGEFTERSLARVFGVSQPHLHNVLKGVRRLNIDFADLVMAKLNITIFDLISEEEILNSLDIQNPNWLTLAATRKPPLKSKQRENDLRAPWRTNQSGA